MAKNAAPTHDVTEMAEDEGSTEEGSKGDTGEE